MIYVKCGPTVFSGEKKMTLENHYKRWNRETNLMWEKYQTREAEINRERSV